MLIASMFTVLGHEASPEPCEKLTRHGPHMQRHLTRPVLFKGETVGVGLKGGVFIVFVCLVVFSPG